MVCYNIVLIISAKLYYKSQNNRRERKWRAMSDADRAHYLETTTDTGNKRYEHALRYLFQCWLLTVDWQA